MIKTLRTTRLSGSPRGAALAEVLIAVIAMGIGVMSLAALFPVAVLRSVQGHQLTQGTILRFAAEAKLDTYKFIFKDPDRDGTVNNPSTDPNSKNFLFDPLGFAQNQTNGTLGNVNRYHGGFNSVTLADQLVTADDNWVERYAEVATSFNLGTAPYSATIPNLTAQGVTATTGTRAVIFDVTGSLSQVRPLKTVNGDVIEWDDPLPASFTSVGKVRIETQERQFTWMLTCRRTGTTAPFTTDIDVTVFFRRSFPTPGEDVINNGGGLVFTAGSNAANVTFTGGNTPALRRGSFIFDAVNARWYRMEKIVDNTTSAVITLDRPAVTSSNSAVFFAGIVDVYPLGTKTD